MAAFGVIAGFQSSRRMFRRTFPLMSIIVVADLLTAEHLGRLVRERRRDVEAEAETSALLHALVRLNEEDEGEDVVRVGELVDVVVPGES